MYSDKFLSRFWSKVDRSDTDSCWLWTGARVSAGYGQIRAEAPSRDRCTASVVSLEIALGRKVVPGLFACHTCDNPPCCNPKHLYEGSISNNVRDALDRGRLIPRCQEGSLNSRAILTESDIPSIRARIAGGETNTSIAKSYGLHHATISAIRRGKSWNN